MKKKKVAKERVKPLSDDSLTDLLIDSAESSMVDIDERYARAAIIGEADDTSVTRNIFTALSAEMKSSEYKIRKPAQQALWAKNKSECQKQLAKHLLRFKSVFNELIAACENPSSHLFGVFKEEEGGMIIVYPKDLPEVVRQLLLNYETGHSGYSFDEIVEFIVEDYNLSYAHFIKPQAARLIEEFQVAKSSTSNIIGIKVGHTGCLFDETSIQSDFSDREGVSWVDSCSILRIVNLLCLRIKELRNRLVSTNLRSCLSSALAFYHKGGGSRQSSVGELDLISEGAEGLMYACDMYVYGCNARFTTYADNWIKLKISRYIKNNNSVRIPIHATDLVNTILRHLKPDENSMSSTPLNKKQVEALIGDEISDSIWKLAINRHNNIPVNISCVNNSDTDDETTFDVFSEVIDENEDHIRQAEFAHVIKKAKELVKDSLMTPRQLQVLELKYIDELSHAEIAKVIGGDCTEKHVRKDAKHALESIKIALGVIKPKGTRKVYKN